MSIDVEDHEIVVSRHAAIRWDQRTSADSVAPETAWCEARPLSVAQLLRRGNDIDEVRYHDPTGTILLRGFATIVTVLDRDDKRSPELWGAVDRQFSIPEESA